MNDESVHSLNAKAERNPDDGTKDIRDIDEVKDIRDMDEPKDIRDMDEPKDIRGFGDEPERGR